jgi:hypothetical protein
MTPINSRADFISGLHFKLLVHSFAADEIVT